MAAVVIGLGERVGRRGGRTWRMKLGTYRGQQERLRDREGAAVMKQVWGSNTRAGRMGLGAERGQMNGVGDREVMVNTLFSIFM